MVIMEVIISILRQILFKGYRDTSLLKVLNKYIPIAAIFGGALSAHQERKVNVSSNMVII